MKFLIICFVIWGVICAADSAEPSTQMIALNTALPYILGGIVVFLIICPAILIFVFCKIMKSKGPKPGDVGLESDSENSDSKTTEV